jgi:DNA (cytosine-5)-methyltransferase 1
MENVPGLKNMEKGIVLRNILQKWEDLGYSVSYHILNAAEYGVPQFRKRMFIVGFSEPVNYSFPLPTHGPQSDYSSDPLPYVTIGETFSKLNPQMPNQELPRHTKAKIERLRSIVPGSAWKGWHYRDNLSTPSRTITGHCRDDWVHPTEPRSGTVRELSALQSFPNDYIFKGPIMGMNWVKENFQYRQVGNAVPILLAKAVGMSILKQILNSNDIKLDETKQIRVEV